MSRFSCPSFQLHIAHVRMLISIFDWPLVQHHTVHMPLFMCIFIYIYHAHMHVHVQIVLPLILTSVHV